MNRSLSRRRFLRDTLCLAGGVLLLSCGHDDHINEGQSASGSPAPPSTASPTASPAKNGLDLSPTSTSEPTATVSPEPTEVPVDTNSLRYLAGKIDKDLAVGSDYAQSSGSVILNELNSTMLTSEVAWWFMERDRGKISENATRVVSVGEARDMSLSALGVIFSLKYPEWVSQGNFAYNEASDIVKKRVSDVATLLKGNLRWLGVVNEFHPWKKEEDPLQRAMGNELLDVAYEEAREADPNAMLLYSDNHNHSMAGGAEDTNSANYSLTKSYVDRLRSQGLIDGVGLQMHIDASNPPYYQDLVDTARSYGIPVVITELEVTGGDEQTKAAIYKNVIQAELDSGVCKGIYFWNTRGHFFDSDGYPNAASQAVKEAFQDAAN